MRRTQVACWREMFHRSNLLVLAVFVVLSFTVAIYYAWVHGMTISLFHFKKLNGLDKSAPPKLVYRRQNASSSSWVFRILQIADIHLGEAESMDWGPEQDRKTFAALDRIVRAEAGSAKLDLIICSGDQLTANNVDANATLYYEILAQQLSTFGIPFAMIFGNHDDAPFEYESNDQNGTIHQRPAKTSRRQLIRALGAFELSLSQAGPLDVFGVSNYWLDLWAVNQSTLASRILLLDTGGGSLEQSVAKTQLNWFLETNIPETIPVVAFAHIPTAEFAFTKDCLGEKNEGVSTVSMDGGLVNVLHHAGNVHVLGVGHDHGNDYCCPASSLSRNDTVLHLCFGRHSGYGGYGSWLRGARVYELTLTDEVDFSWKTYVRMESGEIQDYYDPFFMR